MSPNDAAIGTGEAGGTDTSSARRRRVSEAVATYMAERLRVLGKPARTMGPASDLFGEGLLDSVALTGLIAAVEAATGSEIDFIEVDPDALGTVNDIVEELTRVIGTR